MSYRLNKDDQSENEKEEFYDKKKKEIIWEKNITAVLSSVKLTVWG